MDSLGIHENNSLTVQIRELRYLRKQSDWAESNCPWLSYYDK